MTIKEPNKVPNYVEDLARFPGLTWRDLASRMGVSDRRGLELRLPEGPGRRRESGGGANPDRDGHGG